MKRTVKIVGVVMMVTLGTLAAYADNCTQNGASQPYGTPDTAYFPTGPSVVGNPITTYCSSSYSAPLPAPPNSPDRPSFVSVTGQSYLDTINWGANPFSGPQSPVYYNGGTGTGTSPAQDYPSPRTGGVNGTGYSLGQVPATAGYGDEGTEQMNLTTTGPVANILYGDTPQGDGLGLGWDTSTTGETYNPNALDNGGSGSPCYMGGAGNPGGSSGNPHYDADPSCWTVTGPNSGAIITGVGFDIQLAQQNGDTFSFAQFSVTFAIYGATPGCSPNGFVSILGNPQSPDIQCYDYQNATMTDNQGDSAANASCPDGDPTCVDYSASNVQLLGYVTVNSDLAGDAAFFGFTTNDPYGVGEVVMVGNTFGGSENADVNFAINQVTLLTQQATPEPTTLLLFGSGLLVAARRLRKKATVKS